jgi:hypothetical protein
MGVSIMAIIALLLTTSLSSANALVSPCDNGIAGTTASNRALPVILVHGYNDGSWVFSD